MKKLKAILAIIRGDAVIFNVAFLTHVSMLPRNPGQSLFVSDCEFKGNSGLYEVSQLKEASHVSNVK